MRNGVISDQRSEKTWFAFTRDPLAAGLRDCSVISTSSKYTDREVRAP